MANVTIRLDDELHQILDELWERASRSRSEMVRDLLRRQFSLMRFDRLRKQSLLVAEWHGYLTENDVLRDLT